MQQTIDLLINEFYDTVGSEKGIVIKVTAVFSSTDLSNETAEQLTHSDKTEGARADFH